MSLLLEALKQAQKEKDRLKNHQVEAAAHSQSSSPALTQLHSSKMTAGPAPAPSAPLSLSLSDQDAPLSQTQKVEAPDFSSISLTLSDQNAPLSAAPTPAAEASPTPEPPQAFPSLSNSFRSETPAPAPTVQAEPAQSTPFPSFKRELAPEPSAAKSEPEAAKAPDKPLPALTLNTQNDEVREIAAPPSHETTPIEPDEPAAPVETQPEPTTEPHDAAPSLAENAPSSESEKRPPEHDDNEEVIELPRSSSEKNALRAMFTPPSAQQAPKATEHHQDNKNALRAMFTPSSPNDDDPKSKAEPNNDALNEMRHHAQRLLTATHTHKINKVSPIIIGLGIVTLLFAAGFAYYWYDTSYVPSPIVRAPSPSTTTEVTQEAPPLPDLNKAQEAQNRIVQRLQEQPNDPNDISLDQLPMSTINAATQNELPPHVIAALNAAQGSGGQFSQNSAPSAAAHPSTLPPPDAPQTVAAPPPQIYVQTNADGSRSITNLPAQKSKTTRTKIQRSSPQAPIFTPEEMETAQHPLHEKTPNFMLALTQAEQLKQQGKMVDALKIYREIANEKAQPNTPHLTRAQAVANFELGNHFAKQNHWEEAQKHYFSATTAAPYSADFALNLAVSLDHLNLLKPAHEHYVRALTLSVNDPFTNFSPDSIEQRVQQLSQTLSSQEEQEKNKELNNER